MGIHRTEETPEGWLIPICNCCSALYGHDIPYETYELNRKFWEEWTCKDCNGGVEKRFEDRK